MPLVLSTEILGNAIPSSNYVPITNVSFADQYDFYRYIERRSSELSFLLYQDRNLSEFLKYIFIETIRNVYEHAETNELFVCAQKWPTMNLVEIAIADRGCGISKALRRTVRGKTDKELLYMSTMPGVSAPSNHSYLERDDAWRNSGYGLYVLQELSKAYKGSFLLCSGNYAIEQTWARTTEYETDYTGTALAIRFKTDTNIIFADALGPIVEKGEQLAKSNEHAIQKASKSSGGHYGIEH